MNKNITISDPSLRDGNHSVKHQISLESIKKYCLFADKAKIPVIEVGHGNGLGASSILIGECIADDESMLTIARENLKTTKLGVHVIPGLATIEKDILRAMDIGVDVYRVATHCTEATLSKSHIEFLRTNGQTVHGTLMMTALASAKELTTQAKIMEEYGAEAIIIMDSTGTYLPSDVKERITMLCDNLSIDVGFHGHNNLSCAVANSLMAAECGARIIDACLRGFGAGAGNTQLEAIIPVLEMSFFKTGVDFAEIIKGSDEAMGHLIPEHPVPNPVNILTGLNKLFSGFEKPILKISKLYDIEYSSLIFELGNRKLVAGQEDLIAEIAQKLQIIKKSENK
jgi:4-hydroxy 2-oxovalerate aldolase